MSGLIWKPKQKNNCQCLKIQKVTTNQQFPFNSCTGTKMKFIKIWMTFVLCICRYKLTLTPIECVAFSLSIQK